MNEFDALRATLNAKAEAAANAAGLEIELPNEQFTPPAATTYATFFYRTGGSKQCELGANTSLEMTVGIFQFDVLVPEYQNIQPGTAAADILKKAWSRKQWDVPPDGYVNILVANVKTPFPKPILGYYRIIVDGTFHFYHRDPTAADFRS